MSDLWLLAAICFVAMISPGPDFILVTQNALRYPQAQALSTAAGIVCGCLLHATYCTLGLALIITKSVLLFSTIKIVGACYLVYLGVKGLLSAHIETLPTSSSENAQVISAKQAFLQGWLCNILNPKLAVFLLSLFTQFVSPQATVGEKALVAGIFVIESAIYWPLVAVLFQGEFLRRLFSSSRVYIDRTCGVMLIALGLRVAFVRE